MKKIAIVTSLFLAVVFPRLSFAYLMGVTEVVNQCNINNYAVVYINGVLNTKEDAEMGRRNLELELKEKGINFYNGEKVVVRKAFNPSHFAGLGDSLTVALQKAFDQVQHTMGLDYDAKEMIAQMHDEVKEGRILFVPHSQGNFYANSIYEWLATRENGVSSSSMAMYNVASPAQMAAVHPRYILSKNDKVIAGLVGAVGTIAPPNVEFPARGSSNDDLGHNFVDTYLHYGGDQMAKDIRAQLALLEEDKGKNPELPCIPEPDAGVAHFLLGAYYNLVDPVTIVARDTIADLANFAYVITGSVFSSNTKLPEISLRGTEGLPDRHTTATLAYSFTPSNEYPTVEPSAVESKVSKTITKKPKVVKPAKVDPDAALKLALLERIALLKRLLKAEAKLESQVVTSSVIRGGGSLPTARAHALDDATSTVSTPVPLGFEAEDNLPQSHMDDGLDPGGGHLLITEYYIGKQGEASWVELMNTTDRWLDMRTAEFVDDNDRTAFPLTGIPPRKYVVLKSEGTMAHAILQSEAPYRVITGLYGGLRTSGEFVVLSSHNLVDRAPYGPSYCSNQYALRRSCERMVTAYPGDNPEYWVRARALLTPTQYENASTIGYENQSWNYHIYEGKLITGTYPGEVLPRGHYVTGIVNIAVGEDWRVDNAHPWMLAIPDAAIFGGSGQTVVHVYGTLNIWKTGAIDVNKNFANYSSVATRPIIETIPHVVVHEGGVFVRDPYSYLNAPVIIRGGTVRLNTVASRIRLESGKLYLTYYQDGTSPGDPPSCDNYKDDEFSPIEWLGGKLYRVGVDCGSSLYLSGQSEGDIFIGPNDPFGVVASLGVQDCRIYYASRNAEDCSEFYGLPPGTLDPPWEEPPAVAGTSTATSTPQDTGTSTATSTAPITQDNGSGTSTASTTATSTPSVPGDSGNGTSTATSTPVLPGEGSTSDTTTPATTTPPISPPLDTASSTGSSTPPVSSPGDVLGTSTASTTPPIADGGTSTSTSTSTPPETGNGAATSTASTTPPVGDSGSATSTASSTPPAAGGDTATSTASSTPPVGDGGGSATSTPGAFCYEGPPYYEGITLEELNATCGHGWAPRPTIFPITMWGRNPLEERMQITEYYIGATGEASWFKISNMMGFVPVDLGITDIFMGTARKAFPVLSILARQYVLLLTPGALTEDPPATSMNGGTQTTEQYRAVVLPALEAESGSLRFRYTTSLHEEGTDLEVLNFVRGECPGVLTSIGSCVLLRPYMIGNYPGDAGYVPWSMPEQIMENSLAEPSLSSDSSVGESFRALLPLDARAVDEVVEENSTSDKLTPMEFAADNESMSGAILGVNSVLEVEIDSMAIGEEDKTSEFAINENPPPITEIETSPLSEVGISSTVNPAEPPVPVVAP